MLIFFFPSYLIFLRTSLRRHAQSVWPSPPFHGLQAALPVPSPALQMCRFFIPAPGILTSSYRSRVSAPHSLINITEPLKIKHQCVR